MPRWEPFAIFCAGFLYVGFIVYLSKPSLPNLNATEASQFKLLNQKHLVFQPERVFVANADNEISFQQNNTELGFKVDGTISFMLADTLENIVLSYYTIHEESLTFYISQLSSKDGALIESDKLALPGHLGISDIVRGYDGSYLYKRKHDSRLFRIFENSASCPGPLFTDFPGRLLSFAYLYSPDRVYTVFAAQYLPTPNSKLFEVSFSIYTSSEDQWNRQLLWSVQLFGLGNNMIDADQVDYLYFLTKALVYTRTDGKMVSFVFMEHLFTISINNGNQWKLNTQPIVGLHGADYDVDIIYSTVNNNDEIKENLIVLVAEQNRCFVFSDKRMADMGLFARLRGHLGVYNDLMLFVLQEAFHLWLFPEDILELSSTPLPTSLIESNAQSNSSWNVLGMWSPESIYSEKGRKIIGVCGLQEGKISLLLEDGLSLVIDTNIIDQTWPSILFLARKWSLILSLVSIVLLFAANEIR
jgi:hypothetical protein